MGLLQGTYIIGKSFIIIVFLIYKRHLSKLKRLLLYLLLLIFTNKYIFIL